MTLRPLVDAGPAAWRRVHAHFRDPEIAFLNGTPPSRMPRPPSGFSSMKAPAWVAILPAISLIGASSGRRPAPSSTVS